MSKSNTFEDDFLKLVLNGTSIANLADNAASAPATLLYLSLHTADPGEAGTQSTSEIAYTGYARKSVPRTSAEISVTGGVASIVNNQDFPEMTGGAGGTVTFFALGTAASGAGKILWSGAVSPTILVQSGVTPRIKGSASGTPTTISED